MATWHDSAVAGRGAGAPRDVVAARALVERLFRDHPTKRFAVRLWDGTEISWGAHHDFTLVFPEPGAFRALVAAGDPTRLAEAYVDGRLEVEGSLDAAVGLARYLSGVKTSWRDRLRLATSVARLGTAHGRAADVRNVRAHYDLSDDFFRLFLDERMVYSCAYFARPGQDLETAQRRKLDLTCRKLGLQPGESFLDVGCGWGALVIWAAANYGVTATGITLSRNQAAEARRRVAALGLGGRVTIEERHYRDLPAEAFDKIASIGMYEHVGVRRYGDYFGSVFRALRPGGVFLNHGITGAHGRAERNGGDFIFRHVFPGAELGEIGHTQVVMEASGFEVVDVQSLRPHYALTLREWARRLEARRFEAASLVPPQVLRAWRIYLAGCAQGFEDAIIGVYQVLAVPRGAKAGSRLPLTREEMLRGDRELGTPRPPGEGARAVGAS